MIVPLDSAGYANYAQTRSYLALPQAQLLPLAVASPNEERDHSFVWVFIALAALCVGQVFTLRETWVDLRYTYQSFLLLIAFVAILARIAWQSLALAPLRPGAAAGDLSRAAAKARPAVRWRRR